MQNVIELNLKNIFDPKTKIWKTNFGQFGPKRLKKL